MTSAAPIGKKSALCRYFMSSGSCVYGEDCQFLHQNPIAFQNFQSTFLNGPPQQNGPISLPDNSGMSRFCLVPTVQNYHVCCQKEFARSIISLHKSKHCFSLLLNFTSALTSSSFISFSLSHFYICKNLAFILALTARLHIILVRGCCRMKR